MPLGASPQSTRCDLLQLRFLQFGLNMSPGIFAHIMNGIIVSIPDIREYLDDVIVDVISERQRRIMTPTCGNFSSDFLNTTFGSMQPSRYSALET